MASWTSPKTWAVGDLLTASDMNTYVRDNTAFLGSAASASLTASGTIFATATYSDLLAGGVGPVVVATTGTKALVLLQCQLSSNVDGDTCAMGFNVSGATTIAASIPQSIQSPNAAATAGAAAFLVSGLTAGSNTFTCKYAAPAAPASYANRVITVIPLP